MKIFLDSDILLDVLLNRSEHYDDSAGIVDWSESHPGRCAVSWHSLANIHYISKNGATAFIRELLNFCVIPPSGTNQMKLALDLGFSDLEDAMQVSTAMLFDAQVLCTRNLDDFRASPIQIMHPNELLSKLY